MRNPKAVNFAFCCLICLLEIVVVQVIVLTVFNFSEVSGVCFVYFKKGNKSVLGFVLFCFASIWTRINYYFFFWMNVF